MDTSHWVVNTAKSLSSINLLENERQGKDDQLIKGGKGGDAISGVILASVCIDLPEHFAILQGPIHWCKLTPFLRYHCLEAGDHNEYYCYILLLVKYHILL